MQVGFSIASMCLYNVDKAFLDLVRVCSMGMERTRVDKQLAECRRACTVGTEQYWYGILDHDGVPRRRYAEIAQTAAEAQTLERWFVNSRKQAQAAVILSFDTLWSHESQWHNSRFSYLSLLIQYCTNNVTFDVRAIETDLARYKLVVLPAFNLMRPDIAKRLTDYVANGGTLVVTFRSGTREWDNRMTTLTLPGYFKDLAGVEIEEFDSLNAGAKVNLQTLQAEKRTVKIKGIAMRTTLATLAHDLKLHLAMRLPFAGKATMWCDVIAPLSAEVLARYAGAYYRGKAAITRNRMGKGSVYYVGCDLDMIALMALLRGILRETGMKPFTSQFLQDIEIVERISAEGNPYVVILNHADKPQNVQLPGTWEVRTAKKHQRGIRLGPFETAVLGQ